MYTSKLYSSERRRSLVRSEDSPFSRDSCIIPCRPYLFIYLFIYLSRSSACLTYRLAIVSTLFARA